MHLLPSLMTWVWCQGQRVEEENCLPKVVHMQTTQTDSVNKIKGTAVDAKTSLHGPMPQGLCVWADTDASTSLLVCSSILSPRSSDPTDPYLPFLLSTQWALSVPTGSGQRTTEISWSHSYPDGTRGMGRSKNHLFGSGPVYKGSRSYFRLRGSCGLCGMHNT